MQCEFCKETVADGALICPHCRTKTAAGRAEANSYRLKLIAAIIAVPVALFLVMAALGSRIPEKDPSQRISDACAAQFNEYSDDYKRCRFDLTLKALDNIQREKMDGAEKEAQLP